jgi:hypothetical protein
MHYPNALRFISLPVAAGLGVALVVACANDPPTAPQKFNPAAPTFTVSYTDDVNGACPNGYKELSVTPGLFVYGDTDGDGLTCRKGGSGGGGKKGGGPKK